MKKDGTVGPFIKWLDYGHEGWKPTSYDSLLEALADTTYGNSYIITRPVKFVIQEVDDNA